MSDLKHHTPDELRNLIRWCEAKRAENDHLRKVKRAQIDLLEQEVAELGRKNNNIGQKEVWARIWLARKETGQIK